MYIDLIFLLNFLFDFLLLLSVSIILRRNIKLRRIILGSIFGSLTIFILFLKVNTLNLFILKVILSILMIFITFGYKDIKYNFNNFLYFYTTSIILGGFLYFLEINISYKNVGMYFYNNSLGINYIVLILTSPLILYIYIKQAKELKNHYSLTYKVKIFLKNNEVINVNGYLDTANKLVDPYKKRNIILVNSKILKKYIENNSYFLVPYDTVNSHGLLKCIIPSKVIINNVGIRKNVVVGYNNTDYKMDGINCILNNKIMEGK